MEKLSQSDKKKMKNDIYKLNKFQWNKIKDLIDEETNKYTIKNDGIYLRLNLLSNELQIKIKKYIDECIIEIQKNNINILENNSNLIEDSNTFDFIQNDTLENNDDDNNILKNLNNDLITESNNEEIEDLNNEDNLVEEDNLDEEDIDDEDDEEEDDDEDDQEEDEDE